MRNITYRKSDDRFVGRKMINGQLITVYGKSVKEAKENLYLALRKGSTIGELSPRKMTLETFWDKWVEEEKKPFVKERTLDEFKYIKAALKPILSVSLKNLDKLTLQQFLSKLPPSRTREKVYIYLNACLKWAQANDVIKKNPFATIRAPMRKNEHKPPFSYEEQVKILETLKGQPLYPVIIVYLCTGMRKLEFDFKNIEEHIDRDLLILKAENLKGRGSSRRFKNIQLSQELCDFIFEHLDEIHSFNPESAYRQFQAFLKKLGIKGSIVTCRHTYATNNFYLGNPELFISRQMGHKTSQITKDNYTDIDLHLNKEKILKLYNNLYILF